jgi:hypothetical protein
MLKFFDRIFVSKRLAFAVFAGAVITLIMLGVVAWFACMMFFAMCFNICGVIAFSILTGVAVIVFLAYIDPPADRRD